jgi:F0F1-type ATP synthase delta subunit
MKRDILIYFDIITSLKTTQEAEFLVSEIDALMSNFFESEEVSMRKALDSISEESKFKIMQIFTKNNLNPNDRDIVVKFFKTLKELIKRLKVVKLILAFEPTGKTIANIHNFVKETLGIGYILEIEVSKEVLAGAVVIFNGKYVDFSLKKRIEDTFGTKREEILKYI